MSKTAATIFSPRDVPESNATIIPEPFKGQNETRFNRRLGDFAGLSNFGVNLTRIQPGGQSSYMHAHSRQDEFIYVLEGDVVVETSAGKRTLSSGMCAGFPAGTGEPHRFLNEADKDVLLLVVGDRSAGDVLSYPDIDLHGAMGSDGRYVFTRKDGGSL